MLGLPEILLDFYHRISSVAGGFSPHFGGNSCIVFFFLLNIGPCMSSYFVLLSMEI
jgi:hypothetical protein